MATALTWISRPVENTRPDAPEDAPRKAAISVTEAAYGPGFRGARTRVSSRKVHTEERAKSAGIGLRWWVCVGLVGANSFARGRYIHKKSIAWNAAFENKFAPAK